MPRSLRTPPTLADFAGTPAGAADGDLWYGTAAGQFAPAGRILGRERNGVIEDLVSGWGFDPRNDDEVRRILLGANDVKGETFPIDEGLTTMNQLSATLWAAPVTFLGGEVITNLAGIVTETAPTGPTRQWFALYDSAFNLIRQTADAGNLAWPANSCRVRALTAPYTIPAGGGIFYLATYIVATNTPKMLCGQQTQTSGLWENIRAALHPNGARLSVWGALASTPTAPASIASMAGPTGGSTTRPYLAAT